MQSNIAGRKDVAPDNRHSGGGRLRRRFLHNTADFHAAAFGVLTVKHRLFRSAGSPRETPSVPPRGCCGSCSYWEIIWASTGGCPSIRSSGSSTAKGSLPTKCRAHWIACPSPLGSSWRTKLKRTPLGISCRNIFNEACFPCDASSLSSSTDRWRWSSMAPLAAMSHKNNLFNTGSRRFIHRILNQGPVYDWQHFLGHRFRCGEKARAQPGDRKYRLSHHFC